MPPVTGPAQVARWVEVFAQLIEAIVGSGVLGLRREGIGIGADGDLHAQALERLTRHIQRRADHLGLAAVEQQCTDTQPSNRFGRLGDRLPGTQPRHVDGTFVLQCERYPERSTVLRQLRANGPDFLDRALGFCQPKVHVGRQASQQGGQHFGDALRLIQVRAIGAEQRWQRAGHANRYGSRIGCGTGQLPRRCGQCASFFGEPLLPNMERHHRVAVAGDDLGPGLDVGRMDCQHGFRRFAQCQR
ncbi:hypothetical protein D3C81_1155660 [compost metagenome]